MQQEILLKENNQLKREVERLEEIKEALEARIRILEGNTGEDFRLSSPYLQEEKAAYSKSKK